MNTDIFFLAQNQVHYFGPKWLATIDFRYKYHALQADETNSKEPDSKYLKFGLIGALFLPYLHKDALENKG